MFNLRTSNEHWMIFVTAEVAIVKRSAVVLAADSAVTIDHSQYTTGKVYDTADKIFQLCEAQPIALMIYNNVEFFGIPIEILAKEFRRHCKSKNISFDTVRDCSEYFLDYLLNNHKPSNGDLKYFHELFLHTIFDPIKNATSREFSDLLTSKNPDPVLIHDQLDSIFERNIAQFSKQLECDDDIDGNFYETYIEIISKVLESASLVLVNDKNLKLFARYAWNFIKSNEISANFNGLVFAGYGSNEVLPSLMHFQCDCFIDEKLKFFEVDSVSVERREHTGFIKSFAQQDVIRSYVDGISPEILNFIKAIIREIVPTLSQSDGQQSAATIVSLTGSLDRFISDRYIAPIHSMIAWMPKQELAALATTLIEITCLRRRVTMDHESVGGDVDLAVITKSEGLVWVKRKHYFPAQLNPRYFKGISNG